MPRVNTRTKNRAGAARFCGRPGCGREIKPGDRYFTWSFRYGGTHFRCADHRPRRSETTQSLMGEVYAAIENAEDQLPNAETVADIIALVEEVGETKDGVAEQYRDAAEPFGGAGENADRADELESWDPVSEFQPDEEDEEMSQAEQRELVEAAREAAQDVLNDCPL